MSMLVDQTANDVLWNRSMVVWERYGAIYGGNGSQMLHSWVVWLQLFVHGGRIRNESSNKSRTSELVMLSSPWKICVESNVMLIVRGTVR